MRVKDEDRKTMDTRTRLLLVQQMLYNGADDRHGITIDEMVEQLGLHGPEPERKAIYRDMEMLKKFGMGVAFTGGSIHGSWKWENRLFSVDELKRIIDAVNAFPWITTEQRDALTGKLAALACKPERVKLNRPTATRWTGNRNESEVAENLDKIQAAMRKGKSIRFAETENGPDGKIVQKTQPKTVSPAGVIFRDGYYWFAYSTDSVYPSAVRVDKMTAVSVVGIAADENRAPADYCLHPFGVDGNRLEPVVFRADGTDAISECIDRFWGTHAAFTPTLNGNGVTISARVCVTPEWWGWLAKMDGAVTVVAPEWVRAKAEEKRA